MSNIVVSSLSIYPVKSCAAVPLNQVEVSGTGFKDDRRYLIAKLDGGFVTGRTHPKITALTAVLGEGCITLSFAGVSSLTLNVNDFDDDYRQSAVWGTEMSAQYCGQKAQQWLSEVLGDQLQLLYFGTATERKVVGHPEYDVAFADGFPYLLIGDASLVDLNRRLLAPVSMRNFRPNITVQGAAPFAEDEWAKIRIGEVIFELPKPCSRCIFTTVDPDSQLLDPQREPLKTLSSYRQMQGETEVMFGENLIAVNRGIIKLGDSVEVLEYKPKPSYPYADQISDVNRMLAHGNAKPIQTKAEIMLRCVGVTDETRDVTTFKFSADPVSKFVYLPGQFITLHLDIDGQMYDRCYTLSSSPSRADTISITVKRVNDGVVSNWLHDHIRPGAVIKATPPAGVFHLHARQPSKLLLLSGGSGVTPMLSMLRYITDLSLPFDVQFHHSAHSLEDFIACSELLCLAKQFANVHLSLNLTVQEQAVALDIPVYFGRFRHTMLQQISPDLHERHVMVCGPQGFMKSAYETLMKAGLSAQQYEQESFNIELPARVANKESVKSYQVEFVQSGITIEIDPELTILEAAEDAGVDIDYSCRGGMCGSCVTPLLEGEVEAQGALALSAEDVANGDILACCSYARSDLKIDC